MNSGLELELLDTELSVCRLEPEAVLPPWADAGHLVAILRSEQELSIACPASAVPDDVRREGPFRAIRVRGPLDFSLVGILADLTATLAAVEISLLAISSFDTDYLLVRAEDLDRARVALAEAGHHLDSPA